MAVPASALSSKNLQVMKNGQIVYHNIALGLGETLETIKARFYLDYILNTSAGFIGCCYVGGYNYNFHASHRIGVINMFKSGQLKAYNDAGLNTLPFANIPTAPDTRLGTITLNAVLKSSYYNDTTSYGFQYFSGEWLESKGTATDGFPSNTTMTKTEASHAFGMDEWQIRGGQNVSVRAYVTNSEGTHYSQPFTFTIQKAAIVLGYDPTTASYAVTSANKVTAEVDVYPFFSLGTRIRNEGVGDSILDGYYYYPVTNKWMYISKDPNDGQYSTVKSSGDASAGNYPTGDIGNPPPVEDFNRFTYHRFDTTLGNACGFATITSPINYLYMPKNVSPDRYYANTGLNQLPTNGYYVRVLSNDIKRYYYIVNGSLVSQGQCGTGTTPD